MEVLDRVLVSESWEALYPLSLVTSLTRSGSDHCAIVVNLGNQPLRKTRLFRMETTWFSRPGFKDMVKTKWPARNHRSVLDFWKVQQCELRKFLRGWAKDDNGEFFRIKNDLLCELDKLNEEGDEGLLVEEDWKRRYQIEENLSRIYAEEELYWQRRGGEQWLLKGDCNTSFFHSVANGRRRKTTILSLEDEGLVIEDTAQLRNHINGFYKNLFGFEPVSAVRIDPRLWDTEEKLSEGDRVELGKPFSMEEIEFAVKTMKTNTAPGPDGFSVQFYKEFGRN